MSKKELHENSNKKERILITLNALGHNRGSEALVRGLVKAVKSSKPDAEIVVCSGEEKHQKVSINGVDYMYPRLQRGKKYSPIFCVQVFLEKVMKKQVPFFYRTLISEAKKADSIYVIGADNYDPLYRIQEKVKQINDMLFQATDAEIYLVDCSLEEKDITDGIVKDISRFKKITVRETISYDAMTKKMPDNKIELIPDPAFIMDKQAVEAPELDVTGEFVGINISDVVLNASKEGKDSVINNYKNVIDYIINELHLKVLLIPHVMGNRDMSALKTLYQMFEEDERVLLIQREDYNAEQIKYIISKCRFIITARTHASIAAYSLCVPTLVIGYSVKSLGIAKDLFGETNKYVVSISELENEMVIKEHFNWIYENEKEIKEHLENFMPAYKEKVSAYGNL